MRPKFSKIVKSGQDLQMGHYLVEIDAAGRAAVISINTKEQQRIIKEILGA